MLHAEHLAKTMLERLLAGCRKYREKNKFYRIIFTGVVTVSSALTCMPLSLPLPLGILEIFESALEESVLDGQYQFSITVPLIISAPLLLDVLGDLFLRIQRLQSKPLCVYLRLILLIVFILPSILLIIPSASLGHLGQRFLSTTCMRNISVAGFLFSFISEEKRNKKKILSNILIMAAFLAYVVGQLLWLISYSRICVMIMLELRSAALINCCASYCLLLYLTSSWIHHRFIEKSKDSLGRTNAHSSASPSSGSDLESNFKSSNIKHPGPQGYSVQNSAVTRRDSMISIYLAVMIVEPIGAAAIAYTSGGFDLHDNTLRAVPWDIYYHTILILLVRVMKRRRP